MSRYNRFKEQFFLARLRTLKGKVLELGFGDADTLFTMIPVRRLSPSGKTENGWTGQGTNSKSRESVMCMLSWARPSAVPDPENGILSLLPGAAVIYRSRKIDKL